MKDRSFLMRRTELWLDIEFFGLQFRILGDQKFVKSAKIESKFKKFTKIQSLCKKSFKTHYKLVKSITIQSHSIEYITSSHNHPKPNPASA
jgi:hypothetical protein